MHTPGAGDLLSAVLLRQPLDDLHRQWPGTDLVGQILDTVAGIGGPRECSYRELAHPEGRHRAD